MIGANSAGDSMTPHFILRRAIYLDLSSLSKRLSRRGQLTRLASPQWRGCVISFLNTTLTKNREMRNTETTLWNVDLKIQRSIKKLITDTISYVNHEFSEFIKRRIFSVGKPSEATRVKIWKYVSDQWTGGITLCYRTSKNINSCDSY